MEQKRKSLHTVLLDKLKESASSVAPVAGLVLVLSLTPWVSFTGMELLVFAVSTLFLILGIGLFSLGADLAMTPLIAIQLLGFRAIVAKRARDKAAMRHIFSAEDAEVIYFEWED